jgi:hypothetical protein
MKTPQVHPRRGHAGLKPLVLMRSGVPFPFELVASQLAVVGVGKAATHAVALLKQWGVPSRLASNGGLAGAHRCYITDLARDALQATTEPERAEVQVFACGPTPMLKPAAKTRTSPAKSRSRNTWPAASAAAPAARCCWKRRTGRP